MKTLISLDLPEDAVQRSSWLEEQLVGLRLGELVEQLDVLLDRKEGDGPSLGEICGDRLSDVVTQGLAVLSADQIQQLIRHPQRLLELQEKIFVDGGAYWAQVPRTDEHRKLVESHWQSVSSRLHDTGSSPQIQSTAVSTRSLLTHMRGLRSMLWLVAAVFLFSVGWWFMQPSDSKWGWDRPGVLAVKLPAKDYLNHLADVAEEWKSQRPETVADLDARLGEFVHGCQSLIAAPHPQLSKDDRTWLYGKCNEWASSLDRDRRELRSRTKSMEQVVEDADKTIGKLIAALRKRASEIESLENKV